MRIRKSRKKRKKSSSKKKKRRRREERGERRRGTRGEEKVELRIPDFRRTKVRTLSTEVWECHRIKCCLWISVKAHFLNL